MNTRGMRPAWTMAIAAALICCAVVWPAAGEPMQTGTLPNLTGTYRGDDGAVYYLEQVGSTLWWAGLSVDGGLNPDQVWHRGLAFTNVFRGTVGTDYTVAGEWSDVTRGTSLNSGTLNLVITGSGDSIQLTRTAQTGGFGGATWRRIASLDDKKFNGFFADIIDRFDSVPKNDDSGSLHDNLKPYRDQTVVFGRIINSHLEYLNDNVVESEIPHVNYGPASRIPHYPDFSQKPRDFSTFLASGDNGDADFDMRLKLDLNMLEPDFYTTGWGDRASGPQVYSLKLNDNTTKQKLQFAGSDGYIGLESVMYGKMNSFGVTFSLLPGWADAGGNSVLINGQPISGNTPAPPNTTCDFLHPCNCDFLQPCPDLNGVTAANYLVMPAGIQLGDLLLSAYGDGKINPSDGTGGTGMGSYLRVTGALVLDCGHSVNLDHTCFDDDPSDDPGDISGHQNQEIHPIYSIDVIHYPFRPEDLTEQARPNMTGAYGGLDGSTYYVRQIGNTIWWLGMLRDREPTQRGNGSPIIGSNELKPAYDAGDPLCVGVPPQCWAFATVFKGTITETPFDTEIEGDWAGVPQSASLGSSGGHQKFFVFNHKIIIPANSGTIFPVTIQKLYEPGDTTAPHTALSIGSPQFARAGQTFVTGATAFTVASGDADVQNVWYRGFAQGSTAPAFTPVLGGLGMFSLAGADGPYQLDSYGTDRSGNDEAAHSASVYLDNTAPAATVAAPAATQYLHSDTFTITFNVSDGAGSGVQSVAANIDGNTTLTDGVNTYPVANGLVVNLLTELPLGTHTFNLISKDNLNNASTQSVTFSIIVTADSIKQDVAQLVASGKVTVDSGNSLVNLLNAAANARAAGNCATASQMYQAFIAQVTALSGKKIDAAAAQIMIQDAQYLMAHCP